MTQVLRHHAERPGSTEALLSRAREHDGADPYDWVVAALSPAQCTGTILDLACGSGALAARLPTATYVGLDASSEELALARQRNATRRFVLGDALDMAHVAGGAVDGIACALALQALEPLREVLAAVAVALRRPGGTFVATSPDRVRDDAALTPGDRALNLGVSAALGLSPRPRNDAGLSTVPELLHAVGLRILDDRRRRFVAPLDGAAAVQRVLDSLQVPGEDTAAVARARLLLLSNVPGEWAISIRRVVAVAD